MAQIFIHMENLVFFDSDPTGIIEKLYVSLYGDKKHPVYYSIYDNTDGKIIDKSMDSIFIVFEDEKENDTEDTVSHTFYRYIISDEVKTKVTEWSDKLKDEAYIRF